MSDSPSPTTAVAPGVSAACRSIQRCEQGLGAADAAAEHRREVRRRVVQLDGHLLPLGRRQQLDLRHAARRVVRRRRQQADEVPREARHRGAVEEVGAVLEPPAELSPLVGEAEAQVEAGDPGGEVERLDREAAQGRTGPAACC